MFLEADGKNGYAYDAARARIEDHVARLAAARRIEVIVEVDPHRAARDAAVHLVLLTYGGSTRALALDHETFLDKEFFGTLILPQLEARIDAMSASLYST